MPLKLNGLRHVNLYIPRGGPRLGLVLTLINTPQSLDDLLPPPLPRIYLCLPHLALPRRRRCRWWWCRFQLGGVRRCKGIRARSIRDA